MNSLSIWWKWSLLTVTQVDPIGKLLESFQTATVKTQLQMGVLKITAYARKLFFFF